MVMTSNGDTGAYPFPPFPRVASSQPFTMRDGMSYLAILEQIQQGYTIIQDEWNDFLDESEQWGDSLKDLWQQFVDKYNTDFGNLRVELKALIHQAAASDNIMVFSPAYGHVVPLQQALDDIYDADRVHGLFAQDMENLEMSPAVFDNIGVSPRMFDLHSTDKVNGVSGEVGKDDIIWLDGVPETHPTLPPDIAQLDARYLKHEPTAHDFSNGN